MTRLKQNTAQDTGFAEAIHRQRYALLEGPMKLLRKDFWNAENRQSAGALMVLSSPVLAYITSGISIDATYAVAGVFVTGIALAVSTMSKHTD